MHLKPLVPWWRYTLPSREDACHGVAAKPKGKVTKRVKVQPIVTIIRKPTQPSPVAFEHTYDPSSADSILQAKLLLSRDSVGCMPNVNTRM